MPKSNLILTIPDFIDNNSTMFKEQVIGVVHDALVEHGHKALASEYAGRVRGYITKHPPQHWNFQTLCDRITGDFVEIRFLSHITRPEVKANPQTTSTGYSASHTDVIEMLADMDDDGDFIPVEPRTKSWILISKHDSHGEIVQQTYDALNSDGYEHEARDFAQRMWELFTDHDPVSNRDFPVTYDEFWTLINEYVYITDQPPHKTARSHDFAKAAA